MNNVRRCECAVLMSRHNLYGKPDYKVRGKSSCRKCQGQGHIRTCETCKGDGLVLGALCPTCFGAGVLGTAAPREETADATL